MQYNHLSSVSIYPMTMQAFILKTQIIFLCKLDIVLIIT